MSGWQGDVIPTANNQTIRVPIARNRDGSAVTGPVLARFVDLPAGTTTASIRLGSMGSAAYPPVRPRHVEGDADLHAGETVTGAHTGDRNRAAGGLGVRRLPIEAVSRRPGSVTRLPEGRVRSAPRVYELVYTAKDPLVLGVGLAATRDHRVVLPARAG